MCYVQKYCIGWKNVIQLQVMKLLTTITVKLVLLVCGCTKYQTCTMKKKQQQNKNYYQVSF